MAPSPCAFSPHVRLHRARQERKQPSRQARRQEQSHGVHGLRTRDKGIPLLRPGDNVHLHLQGRRVRGGHAWDWGAEKGDGPDDDIEPLQVDTITFLAGFGVPTVTPSPTRSATSPMPTTPPTLATPMIAQLTPATPAATRFPHGRARATNADTDANAGSGSRIHHPAKWRLDLDNDHEDDVPLCFFAPWRTSLGHLHHPVLQSGR